MLISKNSRITIFPSALRNDLILLLIWGLWVMPFGIIAQEIHFANITRQDGLAGNAILDMIQDEQGFIWIATESGLSRFDGQHFLTFRFDPRDQESLSGNFINALLEDSRKRLWVGTLNGLNLMLKNAGKFKRIPALDQEGDEIIVRINRIYEDHEHNIWLSTDNSGLFKLREGPTIDQIAGIPFAYQADSSSVNNLEQKVQIIHAEGGYLWISTTKGLDRLHIASGATKHFQIPKLNKSFVTSVHRFDDLWDGRGHIFLKRDQQQIYFLDIHDTDRGIRPFEAYFSELPYQFALPEAGTKRLGMEGDRKLIIASKEQVVWVDLLSGKSTFLDKKIFDKQIISDYETNKILLDQHNNIWFGTYGGGIIVSWRSNQFINFYQNDPEDPSSISSGQIRSLVKDDQGNIWIGTLRNGLHKCTLDQRGKLNCVQNFQALSGMPDKFQHAEIIKLVKDHQGKIWTSTTYNGLYQIDPITLQFQNFDYTPSTSAAGTISGSRIWGLEVDSSNKLWVGTWSSGLNYLDPETGQVKYYTAGPDKQHALLSNFIRTLYLQGDSILWIGTRDGLSRMNIREETFTHFTYAPGDPASLSNNLIWSIYEDRDKDLWIGTNIGLNKFNRQTGQFEHFFESDGLPNNTIYGILEDLEGTLWISTQDGLATKLPDRAPIAFQSIIPSDRLQSLEFLPKAHFLDKQTGVLFFGTTSGLVSINPQGPQQDESPFIPQIHSVSTFDLSSFGKQANHHYHWEGEERQLTLSHREKIVEITLSDLSWDFGSQYKYEYHLSDFSNQWIEIGQENVMTFTNFTPGSYTLSVRRKSLNQKTSPEIALLFLKVLPPWWKTWWAYTAYFILIGGLVYRWYSYKLSRSLQKQEMESLKAIDSLKNNLYTNITHEFRTPLTIISGMAGQIMENPQTWAMQGGRMIKQNSADLLNLVNQILDLRKLEAKELKLNLVQGDVVQYLRYLAQSYRPYAQSMGLQLHFLPAVEKLVMDFDPEKLLRIISNLLSNAVKYTPDEGNIYVHLNQSSENRKNQLKLRIEDTGMGIPADKLPHIFDRFYQVDDSSTRKGEGTGIGLALTRELIHLMKGSIDVNSTLGKGTTFTVSLPITNDSPVREALSREAGRLDPLAVRHFDRSTVQDTAPEHRRTGALNTDELPTLLIVEDNADIRQFLAACLEDHYHLETATNGQEGIDLALEIVPDLIISDVMMPEKDGFELCETLKNDERSSHIPIILLTAKADMESRISGLRTGADAYLTKPFEQEELMVRLKKLFELRQKLQARYRSLGPEAAPENKEDEFVRKVRQAVLANLSDETFGIAQLCRAVTLSRAQLHNKLKALTGLSASHFVRTIRLHKAKELLESSDMNVSEVGYEVGFKNPSHFSSAYQEVFGFPPSKTRK